MAGQRPRYHMHFTLTYSSWLNQVERWFGLITQEAIRRGSFDSVRQLVLQIQRYVEHYNVHKRPFIWTATADSILAKVERVCKVISGTEHEEPLFSISIYATTPNRRARRVIRLISIWLDVAVLDDGQMISAQAGTPQGSVIYNTLHASGIWKPCEIRGSGSSDYWKMCISPLMMPREFT